MLLLFSHTPQHNGAAEHRHRHVVETRLTLLHNTSLPSEFWVYAFRAVVYLINKLPTPTLDYSSSFLKLFGKVPSYSGL